MIVKRRTRGTNGIRPARLAEVSFQLHYAQTQRQSRCQIYTTITWDYTTLKLELHMDHAQERFTTTWDYTTLKPQISKRQVFRSEKWENPPFSYGLEQHSDTTTEYPAAAKRL